MQAPVIRPAAQTQCMTGGGQEVSDRAILGVLDGIPER